MAGRPSKFKSEYCDQLLLHMSEGLSFASFAAKLDVSRDTLYHWIKLYPKFSDTKKRAEAHSLLFWEKLGIKALNGEIKVNAAIWIFNMKNRHGWIDQPEAVENTSSQPKLIINLSGDHKTS